MYTRITHHNYKLLFIALVCLLLVTGKAGAKGHAGFTDPQVPSETCEQHDFGSPGLQLYVYSDGRAWSFTAQTSMQVASVETRSVLASTGGTFNIQVKINGDVVASWSQFVNNSTYTAYDHSSSVSFTLNPGDTITYFIFGGTMSTPAGGITGVNYVRLCDTGETGTIHVTTNRQDATWEIGGASSYSGTGDETISGAPAGEYTITWGELDGCTKPGSGSLQLPGGGEITFNGNYSCSSTTCTVNSTADSGPGTLRACMQSAGTGDTINFDPGVFPPGTPATITLTSAELPEITQGSLSIDASGAGVILSCSGLSGVDGFRVRSDYNMIHGLQITACQNGISMVGGVKYNTLSANVIRDNSVSGISIFSAGTDHNLIIANKIGTDPSGTSAQPNGMDGINLENGPKYNQIGGDDPSERNLISANTRHGVRMAGTGTDSNVVSGNYIGTDLSGSNSLPNQEHGVLVTQGASYNRIGGSNPTPASLCSGECNLISGNLGSGIIIRSGTTHDNSVKGNFIGTNPLGNQKIPNGDNGVILEIETYNNTVGGESTDERNLVSGNTHSGVYLRNNAGNNTVTGNYLGSDASGTGALGNEWCGLDLKTGANHNTFASNLISGNGQEGLFINASGTDHNIFMNNLIGTDYTGFQPLPNSYNGVYIWEGASSNQIGPGNVIAYSNQSGVLVDGATTLENTITQNSIHSNNFNGIQLTSGGNAGISPPLFLDYDLTLGTASGTICPGCTVEVYSDAEDEGRTYEGTAVADGSGAWSLAIGTGFSGPKLTATATDLVGNTSPYADAALRQVAYLPITLSYAVEPPPPTLFSISNPDGDGSYTVSWSKPAGAAQFTLEQDDNTSFTSPVTAYTGTAQSVDLSGQAVGTHFYRVRSENSIGNSSWSNVQSVVVTVSPPACIKHEFGDPGIQLYVYSDGRTWNFIADQSMNVSSIKTKSVLASTSGTFNIQVKVNGSTVASWTQFVNSTLYQPYYHTKNLNLQVQPGDTITYFIYGGSMSTPAGGITGVNYVELCEP